MQQEFKTPWRDRAFVNIPTAAEILGRSREYIEGQISMGHLDVVGPSRRHRVVTVESLKRLIDAELSRKPPAGPVRGPARLRLVVSNHRRED